MAIALPGSGISFGEGDGVAGGAGAGAGVGVDAGVAAGVASGVLAAGGVAAGGVAAGGVAGAGAVVTMFADAAVVGVASDALAGVPRVMRTAVKVTVARLRRL